MIDEYVGSKVIVRFHVVGAVFQSSKFALSDYPEVGEHKSNKGDDTTEGISIKYLYIIFQTRNYANNDSCSALRESTLIALYFSTTTYLYA